MADKDKRNFQRESAHLICIGIAVTLVVLLYLNWRRRRGLEVKQGQPRHWFCLTSRSAFCLSLREKYEKQTLKLKQGQTRPLAALLSSDPVYPPPSLLAQRSVNFHLTNIVYLLILISIDYLWKSKYGTC